MNISVTSVVRRPMWEMSREHFHVGENELYFMTSGTKNIFVGCTVYTLSKGDLIFIPAECLHRVAVNDKKTSERIVIRFPVGAFPHIDALSGEALFHMQEQPGIYELLREMVNEKAYPADMSEDMLASMLNILLIKLLRLPRAEAAENISDDTVQIQRTAQYITMHHGKNITLGSAAEYAGFARTYFSQKFRLVTGFGFSDYLTAVRLKHACLLLRTTSMPISEAAAECGYDDSNYFAAVFKKHIGCTPSEYRKRREQ